jgi:hypothetical protein
MALRDIWAEYEGAWAETDPGKRAETLGRTLDGTFVYVDPNIRTEGRDQLSHYIGELQKTIPGLRIVTNGFTEHHESCLVNWTLEDGQRIAIATGVTCGERAASGLLGKASVFYGPV